MHCLVFKGEEQLWSKETHPVSSQPKAGSEVAPGGSEPHSTEAAGAQGDGLEQGASLLTLLSVLLPTYQGLTLFQILG